MCTDCAFHGRRERGRKARPPSLLTHSFHGLAAASSGLHGLASRRGCCNGGARSQRDGVQIDTVPPINLEEAHRDSMVACTEENLQKAWNAEGDVIYKCGERTMAVLVATSVTQKEDAVMGVAAFARRSDGFIIRKTSIVNQTREELIESTRKIAHEAMLTMARSSIYLHRRWFEAAIRENMGKAMLNATMTGATRDNLSVNTSERELSSPPHPLRGEEGMTPLSLRGRGGTGARSVASGGGTQQPGGGSSTSAGDGGGLTRATRSSTLLVRLRDKTSQDHLSRASRRDAHLPPG